jgi:hypothetical protein
MYNEDFVVLDQSDNFDKLADAVALMKGPMEDGESHSVYIVLAVDYKGGQNRGIFEYAFRVQFGESEEGTRGNDTTPVSPEEDDTVVVEDWATEPLPEDDSTIPNEGWGTDTPPEDDLPPEEYVPSSKYVTYENGKFILTTPLYGKRVVFWESDNHYVDDIDDALVEAAERSIAEQVSQYDEEIWFYLAASYNDDCLYLGTELILPLEPHEAGQYCGDHKHLMIEEPITR